MEATSVFVSLAQRVNVDAFTNFTSAIPKAATDICKIEDHSLGNLDAVRTLTDDVGRVGTYGERANA